jgi:hypothetical protein
MLPASAPSSNESTRAPLLLLASKIWCKIPAAKTLSKAARIMTPHQQPNDNAQDQQAGDADQYFERRHLIIEEQERDVHTRERQCR